MTRRLRTVEEVELYFPGFKAFIDFTEQEILVPVDQTKRKKYYSGKKKKHTVKTQFMVNRKGEILYKSDHHIEERKHDYAVYREEHPQTPQDVKKYLDLGYVGLE